MRLSQLGDDTLSAVAIRHVSKLAAERKISFSLSEDFEELLYVNKCNRDSWDPLMPQYHPSYFDTQRSPAFWIKGVDSSGKIVASRSYRRFDLPEGRTLHDALVDLSFFYDDPKKALPGERVESLGAAPHKIKGSFSFGGALWVHPDARGLGLVNLMWPIGRAVTHDLWDVPLVLSLVEDISKMRSIIRFEDGERGISWTGSYVGPEFHFSLVWWTRDKTVRDVEAFIRGASGTDLKQNNTLHCR